MHYQFLHSIMSSLYSTGDFVVVQSNAPNAPLCEDGSTYYSSIVGQIISATETTTHVMFLLPVLQFVPHNHMSLYRTVQSGVCMGIPELVISSKSDHVSNVDIIDGAFVFTTSYLEEMTHGYPLGIKNAYICRFQYTEEAGPTILVPNGFDRFGPLLDENRVARYTPSSLPKRIWKATVTIQSIFRRALSRYSERQGNYTHYREKVHFNEDMWNYFSRKFDEVIVPVNTKSRQIRAKLINGMKCTKSTYIEPAQQYVFETVGELNHLRGVCGTVLLFGLRRRLPKVGTSIVLRENDIINVVIPKLFREDGTPVNSITNGVRLSFDGNELCVDIFYHRYIYLVESDSNGIPINCPCDILKETILNGHLHEAASSPLLRVGDQFERSLTTEVVEITEVNNTSVQTRVVYPTGRLHITYVYHDLADVLDMVTKYLE